MSVIFSNFANEHKIRENKFPRNLENFADGAIRENSWH